MVDLGISIELIEDDAKLGMARSLFCCGTYQIVY